MALIVLYDLAQTNNSSIFLFKKISLFIFDCAGSLWLCGVFSSCSEQGLRLSCSVWVSHGGGFSIVMEHKL